MNDSAQFTIGKVTGVHGLNGNLRVWSFAQSIDTFSAGSIVLLQSNDGHRTEYTILNASPHKKGILLSLDGVDSRTQAESLIGREILIDRDQLPEPEDDVWYWQDLVGLDVVDEIRGDIGSITQIFPTGANDVLVVKSKGIDADDIDADDIDADDIDADDKEILIPMHKNFVLSVDLEKRVMTTRLPEDYQ